MGCKDCSTDILHVKGLTCIIGFLLVRAVSVSAPPHIQTLAQRWEGDGHGDGQTN